VKLESALNEDYSTAKIKKILKKYDYKLAMMGIKPYISLGLGTMGMAFATDDNRVLKVTSDKEEANACANILGKKLKNVYEIYDVFQFDKTGYYGILQEKLRLLNRNECSFFDSIIISAGIEDSIDDFVDGKIDMKYAMHNIVKIVKHVGDVRFVPDSEIEKTIEIFKQIFNGLQELKIRVQFYDVHIGNIMKRGNDFVLIDIGRSKTAGANIKEI